MKNPTEIKKLAQTRLEEAEILCHAGKYDGAYYLAGYSIELTLKARICEKWDIDDLFDESNKAIADGFRRKIKTHDIAELLIFCGLSKKLQREKARNRILMKTYADFIAPTDKNNKWSDQVRYSLAIGGSLKEIFVKDFITLLKDQQGLLEWIKNN